MDHIDRIKKLRKAANKNQVYMAEILQTTQQQYSKYESRVHELPIRHLITICKHFHVSSDYLLGLEE